MPRYMIERTLPAGAIDGLTDEALRTAQANNAVFGVKWIHSYMSRDKTKTFCIYDGPNEKAVRDANAKNNVPLDRIIEIPEDLAPR
jgi:hypothetical protein